MGARSLPTTLCFFPALGWLHKHPYSFTICSDKSHFIVLVPMCAGEAYCQQWTEAKDEVDITGFMKV